MSHTETLLPPPGWARRGGRKVEGGVGRWVLVLCADCEERAGSEAAAVADGRN